MANSKLSVVERERDALRAALDFALKHCGFFRDGTRTCDSDWHNEGHSSHSLCPSCSGVTASTPYASNRRQVAKYTAVSERVGEILAEATNPTTHGSVCLEFEIGEDVVRLVMSSGARPPLFDTGHLGSGDPKSSLEGAVYELTRDWGLRGAGPEEGG